MPEVERATTAAAVMFSIHRRVVGFEQPVDPRNGGEIRGDVVTTWNKIRDSGRKKTKTEDQRYRTAAAVALKGESSI